MIIAQKDETERLNHLAWALQQLPESLGEKVVLLESMVLQTQDMFQEISESLLLLGAAEELPRLIRALASPHEQLRAAARQAIDRLNAEETTGGDKE